MRIGGLQKTTLLDFPGKVSAVVFSQGCNFFCPYCHNPDLVLCRQEALPLANVIDFLSQRRKLLEGVVITGGEPTLHDGLFSFCAILKSLGYAVKLDTNGSRPEALRRLLLAGLLDYVAMDVKANPAQYPAALCSQGLGENIPRSMALLEESRIAHEFRVPCVAPFIDTGSFMDIIEHIRHAPLFLQAVRLENILRADFFSGQGYALDRNTMENLCSTARQKGLLCQIR
ncbi:MAG: anaerobic ribonucleoside-triphosphate reductase activating protein [Betaproteobacteria bacterium]|nr:anaerobic ribonucleoside-triphosphate reductase activating protein [Betaproteobacteria bacterium]